MTRKTRSLFVAGLILVACGGSTPKAETPETSATSSSEGAAATQSSPAAWSDEMSEGEKAAFMKMHVMPGMAPVFQEYDATAYADFGCATCHGPEGKATREFLPKLKFKDNTLTAFAEQPDVSKFMAEKVSPQMAAVLGKAPYDPATHQGFGCQGCHAISM